MPLEISNSIIDCGVHFTNPLKEFGYVAFLSGHASSKPRWTPAQNLQPVSIELLAMSRIGYTNVRLGKVTFPFEGVGNACGHTLDNGIHSRLFVRFKLGPLGQSMAKLLTRNWPPNATATIDYIMDPSRRLVEVSFSGTVFPRKPATWIGSTSMNTASRSYPCQPMKALCSPKGARTHYSGCHTDIQHP